MVLNSTQRVLFNLLSNYHCAEGPRGSVGPSEGSVGGLSEGSLYK